MSASRNQFLEAFFCHNKGNKEPKTIPPPAQIASNTPTGIWIDCQTKNLIETGWIFWIEKIAIALTQIAKIKELTKLAKIFITSKLITYSLLYSDRSSPRTKDNRIFCFMRFPAHLKTLSPSLFSGSTKRRKTIRPHNKS